MATETINWNAIVGGTSAPLPTTTVDNGTVLSGFTTNAGSAGNVVVNTTASDPDNNTSNPDNSQLSMEATNASPTSFTVNFSDDTGDAVTSGAYDATFGINDIDAGSGSGFRDKITITALDTDGNPLSISVAPNSNYTATTNPDGTVTLLANSNTNSWNDPGSYAQVTVSGGPIASISVNLENVGNGSNNIMLTEISYNAAPICFARGTMILTDRGEVAVEDLRSGDLVQTRDHGLQEIRWVDSQTLSGATLEAAPHLRPIRIAAGALGDNTPTRDLVVSPQHRILVRSRIAQKMFGTNEVLVAAKQLLLIDGIDVAEDLDGVDYYHFLFQDHEVVISNGAESESLYTGPQALKTIGNAARAEVFEIFPQLADVHYEAQSARVLASGRMGRRLAHRHAQNNKRLVS